MGSRPQGACAAGWRPLMELIGRDPDVASVERELGGRLVTLVGAGGVGKSAVARHVIDRARLRGATTAWVDLGWVTDVDEMTIEWSRALGDVVDDGDALVAAIDRLGPALVVIDNCEHLAAVVRPLVERIVGAVGHLRVLATSRDSLGLAGERLWRLSGLPSPPEGTPAQLIRTFPAVELFLARLSQVRPGMIIGEAEEAEIGAICRLLNGNPLAVILAAGQVRAMSLVALRTSVETSNMVLGGPSGATEARHASVDASIRWSVDLLNDDERDVLLALAAFPGAFDLDAAEAVGRALVHEGNVAATIGRLVDHGLVDFDGADAYQLPFVVRRFALEVGDQSGQLGIAREHHARLVLGWAAGVTAWGSQVDPASVDRRAVDLHEGLRWAMEHDPGLADRSFASFGVMLHGAVRRQYCDWMAARVDRDLDWARAIGWLAILAPSDAAPILNVALPVAARIAAEAADDHVQRLISCTSVHRAAVTGDLRPARRLVNEARVAEDGWVIVASATTASFVAATLGLCDDVSAFCTATRWACEQGGLPYSATAGPLAEALVAHRAGRPADANRLIAGASEAAVTIPVVLGVRAVMAIDAGDADALDLVRQKLESPDDAYGRLVRTRATIGAHIVRGDFNAAIEVANDSLGRGPLDDAELSVVSAAAALRRGQEPTSVLDELDRTRRAIDQIAEQCPAFDIVVRLLRAQVLLISDDLDGAAPHVFAALDEARTHQQRLLTIDALETVAELLRRRRGRRSSSALVGACARARHELNYRSTLLTPSAAPETERSGDAIGLDGAIALALRSRGARRRPATGIQSLTPTELAVANLVAGGRTNGQIAVELVMSPATVKTHLTHAFAKLGVSNRTQLAIAVGRLNVPEADPTVGGRPG